MIAYRTAFAVLVALSLGLRAYKADAAGVVFDEVMSYFDYGTFRSAFFRYDVPNNHVLNSALIALDRRLFGGWEHGLRVHSVLFGWAFVLGVLSCVRSTLRSRALRVLAFAAITLHWFVFDLSFLARGYAVALGVLYAALAGLLRVARGGASPRGMRAAVAGLIAVNVASFGAMLSSLPFLVGLNAAFFLGVARRAEGEAGGPARIRWRALAATALGSALGTAAVYQGVLRPFLAAPKEQNVQGFLAYLQELFVGAMVEEGGMPARIAWALFAATAAIGLAVRLLRGRTGAPSRVEPAILVLTTILGGALLTMLAMRAAGVSLGYPRNGVFLIPLVLLLGTRAIEALQEHARRPAVRRAARAAGVVALGGMAVANAPSPWSVQVASFEVQSLSRTLVRELERVDPARDWSVLLSPEARFLNLPLLYYRSFGHRISYTLDPREPNDVLVIHAERPDMVQLSPRLFARFDSAVLIRPELLPPDEPGGGGE